MGRGSFDHIGPWRGLGSLPGEDVEESTQYASTESAICPFDGGEWFL